MFVLALLPWLAHTTRAETERTDTGAGDVSGPGAEAAVGAGSAPAEFVHPIDPAHISGSFGEYRKHSRYHHGLDYKTFTRVGIPVRIPRDGVVQRIKSSDVGYGNALWVESDDMRFTFGHLQDFLGDQPGLEYFRLALDYLLPKDSISFHIPPYFRFKQGATMARSGESGSGAPHLHFEVLKNGWYYDPLHLPGLAINDDTAPVLQNVYIETGRTLLKFPVELQPHVAKPGDAPAVGPGDAPAVGPGDAPAAGSGNAPAAGSGNAPAAGSGNAPAAGSGNAPTAPVRDEYRLAGPAEIRLPRRSRVRFLMGSYDTMAASNRNGVSDLRLLAGDRELYSRSLARIRGSDLAGASRVYHTARTVIGSEYVYILYDGVRGELGASRADDDGRVNVEIQIIDSTGNLASLKLPIRFEGDSMPAEYYPGTSGDRGRFRSVGAGSSVSEDFNGARLVLNFDERSLFGGGRVRMNGLPEAEVPEEVSIEVDEKGASRSKTLKPFYRRVGPAFVVETQDLFYRRGANGSAVFPAADKEGLAGLYYYNNTVKRWLLLARPYDTRGGKSYYSFVFRREGAIAQLVDEYPPRIGKKLLWDDPPLLDDRQNFALEYPVFDRGSGIDLKQIEVLLDGRVYPHEWISDRSVIRVVVPRDLVPARGSVLSIRVVDHGRNYSDWFFDCLDPAPSEI